MPLEVRARRGGWGPLLLALLHAALVFRAPGQATPAPGTNHWAFEPVRPPRPPAVRDANWVRNDLDRYVLSRLESEGLRPAAPADRSTLLRRVTFDLTGLPPTPEDRKAFLEDPSPDAWERVVERLLASPRYGERWGRHWMDVVRYADTAGDNADYPVPELYRYRDYLIAAFNADKPFDQFVREQLAGDLLAERGEVGFAEGIVATGFLALSRRYGTGPYELWHLTLENTIETVGQAFLGLNLKCARCHDHKFDPVTMRDYYGLYGIFAGTEFPWAGSEEVQSKNFNRQKFVPLLPEAEAAPRIAAWNSRLKLLRDNLTALESGKPEPPETAADRKRRIEELRKELRTLEKPGGPPDLPLAYAVREGKPVDVPLQKRGEPENPGPVTPRCVPGFLAGNGAPAFTAESSGRWQFAQWLTQPSHPLTARVLVNRLWLHHFGSGLVATPNNLGLRSDPPAQRELLDYLAWVFVERGWSIKAMHRLILGSATYRLSSETSTAQADRDPANRYLGHFDRRRLDAESLRDATLFVAGTLDLGCPGPHPFPAADQWTWTQHNPFKQVYESHHRSVYLMTQRFQRHPFLALFDGPDTNTSTEARRTSIVPQQALFAMNDTWVEAQAVALARRVVSEPSDRRARLLRLLLLCWGRAPSPAELDRWLDWLRQAEACVPSADSPAGSEREVWTLLARVALNANEFLYVD